MEMHWNKDLEWHVSYIRRVLQEQHNRQRQWMVVATTVNTSRSQNLNNSCLWRE
jgi:hypothetical protein